MSPADLQINLVVPDSATPRLRKAIEVCCPMQAAEAFSVLTRRYGDSCTAADSVLHTLLSGMTDSRPETKRASAVLLGLLPSKMIRSRHADVLTCLADAIRVSNPSL